MTATLQQRPQKAETGAYAKWANSLDHIDIIKNNNKIRYKNLGSEIEEKLLEVAGSDPQRDEPLYNNETVNKIILNKYQDDHSIGKTAVYPLSGLDPTNLPSYVIERSVAAYFLDRDPEFPVCSCDGKIIEMRHDVRRGLPGIKNIDLVILKGVITNTLERMHDDIKENMRPGGLVACHQKIPNEQMHTNINDREYSLLPNWLYFIHSPLKSYTAPVDYKLSKNASKELSETTGKDIKTLTNLTSWYFFEKV
ncbi:MAG: hypothetical protein ABIE55_02540 [Candidatus Aenigmatarchaeota archaeon]